MAKETLYFTHDFGARNDPKMTKLRIKKGMAGIGAYWVLVEYCYEQGGKLSTDDIEEISDNLRCDFELLKSVIFDFGLFTISGQEFYSKSVLARLEIRREKSEKARESINNRYKKSRKNNTNVADNSTNVENIDSNEAKNATIKERKESKEIKEKEINKTIVEFDVVFNFLKSTTLYRLASETNKMAYPEVDKYFKIFYQSKIDVGDLDNKSKEDVIKHFGYWLPLFIISTNNINKNGNNNQRSVTGNNKRSSSTGPTPEAGYNQP